MIKVALICLISLLTSCHKNKKPFLVDTTVMSGECLPKTSIDRYIEDLIYLEIKGKNDKTKIDRLNHIMSMFLNAKTELEFYRQEYDEGNISCH